VRAAVEAFSQEIDECTAKLASLRRAANDRKEADGKELPEADSSATQEGRAAAAATEAVGGSPPGKAPSRGEAAAADSGRAAVSERCSARRHTEDAGETSACVALPGGPRAAVSSHSPAHSSALRQMVALLGEQDAASRRRGFKELERQWHPDKCQDVDPDVATAVFQFVSSKKDHVLNMNA
jgi:hypothetical protein